MLLIAEIAMLVLGIITVATGKMSVSAGKECRGVPARIAGVLLILPLPIALIVVFGLAMLLAAQGRADPGNLPGWLTLVEFLIFLACVIPAFVIAGMNAQPIGRARAKDYEPDEYRDDRGAARGYADDRGARERPQGHDDRGYDDRGRSDSPRHPPDDRLR